MKWPFRRKSNVDNVPQEIQEYYQTERRERTGVAWLLALGTLLITVGLATLLFFGGRWAYRQIAGDDKNPETSQVAQSPNGENGEGDSSAPAENDGQTQGTTDSEEDRTSSTSTDQPNTGNGQTRGSTTNTSGNLPNTGPADVAALVVVTVIVSASLHYAVTGRE